MKRSRESAASTPLTTRTDETTPRYWSKCESNMSACRGASADPLGGAVRSRTASQQLGHAVAGLGRDVQHVGRVDPEDALDLLRAAVRLGRGQVDLVDHGHHVEVALHRLVAVGQGLGLDALGRVHHQDHRLAGGQRAADLVAEVHVARRGRSG